MENETVANRPNDEAVSQSKPDCRAPVSVRADIALPEKISAPLMLGRLGTLTVKIAASEREIESALRLRFEAFHAERRGSVSPTRELRDEDHFDAYCHHLIVCDEASPNKDANVVATYRLMDETQAQMAGAFYSQSEFDIQALTARHPQKRFLEFGRSCVHPAYRGRRAVELLWHGSWAFVRHNAYDVMFGCASFEGIEPGIHDNALNALRAFAPPTPEWDTQVTGTPYTHCAKDASAPAAPSDRNTIKHLERHLPPIIKGYMRLGAMFSRLAVIDTDFNTTDVLVMLPVERLNPRYLKHYGFDADRMA